MTTLYSDGGDIYEEEITIKDGKHFYNNSDNLIECKETEETINIKG